MGSPSPTSSHPPIPSLSTSSVEEKNAAHERAMRVKKIALSALSCLAIAAVVLTVVNCVCPFAAIATVPTIAIGVVVAIVAIAVAAGIVISFPDEVEESEEIVKKPFPPSEKPSETPKPDTPPVSIEAPALQKASPKETAKPVVILPKEAPKGLKNFGQNNCCINSALQLIVSNAVTKELLHNHLKEFNQIARTHPNHEILKMSKDLLATYEKIIADDRSDTQEGIDTTSFRILLESWKGSSFEKSHYPTRAQYDAGEIVNYLLYLMPAHIKGKDNIFGTPPEYSLTLGESFELKTTTKVVKDARYSEKLNDKHPRQHSTFVMKAEDDSLYFESSAKQDTFYISLFFPSTVQNKPVNFSTLISEYFVEEKPLHTFTDREIRALEEGTGVPAETLRGYLIENPEALYLFRKEKTVKYFTAAPKYLILNLGRIDNQRNKITTLVNGIDLELELKPEWVSATAPARYLLTSFIAHSGSANFGHYWSYVRKDNQWYKCNDSHIECISEEMVKQELAKNTTTAHMYIRQDSLEVETASIASADTLASVSTP